MLVQQFYQSPAPFCPPVVVGPGLPVNTLAPVVSGTTEVGQELVCTTGTWTNSPTGYAYQWFQGEGEVEPPPEGDALTDEGDALTVDGEELTI